MKGRKPWERKFVCVGEERLVEAVSSSAALNQKVQRSLERLSFFGEGDVEKMVQGERWWFKKWSGELREGLCKAGRVGGCEGRLEQR